MNYSQTFIQVFHNNLPTLSSHPSVVPQLPATLTNPSRILQNNPIEVQRRRYSRRLTHPFKETESKLYMLYNI